MGANLQDTCLTSANLQAADLSEARGIGSGE
ncbi:pentapeptide repeat-containing protein [Egbenema bharatensis]